MSNTIPNIRCIVSHHFIFTFTWKLLHMQSALFCEQITSRLAATMLHRKTPRSYETLSVVPTTFQNTRAHFDSIGILLLHPLPDLLTSWRHQRENFVVNEMIWDAHEIFLNTYFFYEPIKLWDSLKPMHVLRLLWMVKE